MPSHHRMIELQHKRGLPNAAASSNRLECPQGGERRDGLGIQNVFHDVSALIATSDAVAPAFGAPPRHFAGLLQKGGFVKSTLCNTAMHAYLRRMTAPTTKAASG